MIHGIKILLDMMKALNKMVSVKLFNSYAIKLPFLEFVLHHCKVPICIPCSLLAILHETGIGSSIALFSILLCLVCLPPAYTSPLKAAFILSSYVKFGLPLGLVPSTTYYIADAHVGLKLKSRNWFYWVRARINIHASWERLLWNWHNKFLLLLCRNKNFSP